ncbi:hypothetical protein [Paenibacillus sp.]|uniref:hypothetical protein n=1 Tax=Paenibacillus sp. TaxID=58172 RepID=UPI002D672F76|nr:hypothetical protein [Paenibacillus sp.]HZG83300.1 hypothetical protein [Paenibacillus sp.]
MGKFALRSAAAAVLLAASALVAGGCGSQPHQMEGNRYADDGYMGLSNSNPNLRTNPGHYTYSKDRQLMRQALREMDLDKQATIWMAGPHVTVTLHLGETVSPEEAAAIRSDAYALLKGNVPRYDYDIRVE